VTAPTPTPRLIAVLGYIALVDDGRKRLPHGLYEERDMAVAICDEYNRLDGYEATVCILIPDGSIPMAGDR
jgi:hypothetical protein